VEYRHLKFLGLREVVWVDFSQNEGERAVDSSFERIHWRSEFAHESGMILAGNGWRRRGAGPGHFNKAAAFA
jgi:hypothetical protein